MKKIILGLLAATAVAAPIAASATAASAATATTCTPSAAVSAVTHTQYKYLPFIGKSPHWSNKDAGRTLIYDWTLYYRATGADSTRVAVDVPAKPAVTCSVALPVFEARNGSTTVPFTEHVKTYLYGVPGHPETEAITGPVTVTSADVDQFWIGYKVDAGYIKANDGTSHIDFAGNIVRMQADSDAAITITPQIGREDRARKLNLNINGSTRWGSVDGHEAYNASLNPGTDGNMTTTYTSGVALHNRLAPIGQNGQYGCSTPTAQAHCVATDRTVEASQAGAVIYNVNDTGWHEYTGPIAGVKYGDVVQIAYNDLFGYFTGNSEGNSGSYRIDYTLTS